MTHIFGKKLKELRKAKGLTQQELVDTVNSKYGTAINRTTISKWENGTQEAGMSFVLIFADFFGVSLDYINGDEKKSTPASAGAKPRGLIEMYEKLSPRNQALLETLLESMLAQQEKDK